MCAYGGFVGSGLWGAGWGMGVLKSAQRCVVVRRDGSGLSGGGGRAFGRAGDLAAATSDL